jgi:uncharacterized repeat protein (TIGR03803 family)
MKLPKLTNPFLVAGICIALSACGGGSSGGSNSGSATGGAGSGISIYTVSVTATGLLPGQHVTLLNNSGDSLVVNANSSAFTFSAAVASGGSYSVTVDTTAGSASLMTNCSVTQGAGTNVTADVTNISVACGVSDTVLYSFGGFAGDGSKPEVGLLQAANGLFYGATGLGGNTSTLGHGTIYSLNSSGSEYVLHNFADTSTDGGCPQAPLIQGSDGNLYGTTCTGGPSDYGTVYVITPGGTETVLHYFSGGADGANPYSALLAADDQYLYGTTANGGANNAGTVFRVSLLGGNAYTTVYAFGAAGDGANPHAALIQGADGNLYGTTEYGGQANYGTIFQLSISGSFPVANDLVLHSFASGADGNMNTNTGHEQAGALVLFSDGYFYGTTPAGGNGYGTVFKIGTTGASYSPVYSFVAGTADGQTPQAALLPANDGNLYGTTILGGLNDQGTVFRITPDGVETMMYSFGANVADGQNPVGGLIQATDGHLYGTSYVGGTYGYGTVFRF